MQLLRSRPHGPPADGGADRPVIDAPATRTLWLRVGIAAFAIVVLAAIWTETLVEIHGERARALDAAFADTEAVLDKQAERTLRTLQQLDQTSRFLKYAIERDGRFDVAGFLRKGTLPGHVVIRINVLDAAGRVAASSAPFQPQSLADREYFRVHQYVDSDALFVDKPIFGRLTNQWNVPMSRRLNHADGSFAGVVSIMIQPSALADDAPGPRLGPQALAAVVGLDNVVRAAHGPNGVTFAEVADLSALRTVTDAPRFDERVTDVSLDGQRRWARARPLTEYAVTVLVSPAVDDVLAGVRRFRAIWLGGASVASLVLLLVSAMVAVQGGRLMHSRADAMRSRLRFQAALDSSLDAFLILRAERSPGTGAIVDFRVVEANARALRLLRRDRSALIGGRIGDAVPFANDQGYFDKWQRVVHTREPLEEETQVRLPGGRMLWMRTQVVAVEDGVAITTRDISARVQAAQALERERAFLRTLLEHIPLGVSATGLRPSNRGQYLFWNRAAAALLDLPPAARPGQTADELFDPAVAQKLRAREEEALRRDEACAFEEIEQQTASGPRYVNVIEVPVRDERGELDTMLGITEDVTDSKRIREQYRQLALTDTLTGLPNRSHFQQHLEGAVARASRRASLLAVLFLDIDNFKTVNDTLGHEVGDALLREVADRLSHAVRQGDFVCRLGGDEFTVVAEQLTTAQDAAAICARLQSSLGEPMTLAGQALTLSASIGVGLYPIDGRDVSALLKSADLAMYKAKEAGRNRFRFYSPQMSAGIGAQLEVEQNLRLAIEHGELFLAYQPQWDAADSTLTGLEALVRWRHPQRGIVPPGEFIPVAERTDLIAAIGDWVIEETCRQIAEWRGAGYRPVPVAVNIGARHFRHANLVPVIEASLARHRVAPELLELEITEGVMMNDTSEVTASFHRLKALGVQVAIDDFGTGYSALWLLRKLPIETLKVDKSFVQASLQDADGRAVLEAIVRLARSLGLRTIAEGVETAEQLELLRALGCDEVQGFLLGRPTEARAIEPLLPRRVRIEAEPH